MYVRATAPRSIGGVLDDGIRLWRDSLPKTWQLAFLSQLLIAIPLVLFQLQLKAPPTQIGPNSISAMSAANAQFMLSLIKSPAFLLGYVVLVLISMCIYNAIVLRIADVSTNDDHPVGRSLSSGIRLVPRELLLLLIAIVAGILMAIAFSILGAGVALGAGQRGLGSILIGFLALSFMVFLAGRLFLTVIALIVQDARAFESLSVSWTLTRGYWWRCGAILTVLIIIVIVLSLVIGFISGLLSVSLGANSLAAIVVSQLLSVIANAVLVPLYPAVMLAIFYDLKLRKEGGDLAGRVNAL
jgi:hypothetical protein